MIVFFSINKVLFMKYHHIVFGSAATGTLNYSFSYDPHIKGNIYTLLDDLSVGPTEELQSLEEQQNRQEWWRAIYLAEGDNKSTEYMNDAPVLEQIKELLEQGEVLHCWVGNIAYDDLGLLRLFTFLKDFYEQIHVVKLQDRKFLAKYGLVKPETIGEMPSEYMSQLLKYTKQLNKAEVQVLVNQWTAISSLHEDGVRVKNKEGRYESKPINYHDQELMKALKIDMAFGTDIVNSVYAITHVNKSFLNWRLKQIIVENELAFKGELKSARDYAVSFTTKSTSYSKFDPNTAFDK